MAGLYAKLAPVTMRPRSRGGGLRDVARGSALNLAGAVVSAVATIGVTLVITRHFSKPVAGAFFAATSLFVIVSVVAGLGAANGVVYFVARLRSLDDQGRIPAMLRAAIRPAACVAVLSAVLVAVAARPLAWGLLGGHPRPGVSVMSVANALRAMAIALPFAALLDTFLSVARGYRDMRPTVLIDRLGRSSGQLLGVTIATVAGSAALLAPLWAAAYVPAAIAALLWLRHSRRRERQRASTAASTWAAPQPRCGRRRRWRRGPPGHPDAVAARHRPGAPGVLAIHRATLARHHGAGRHPAPGHRTGRNHARPFGSRHLHRCHPVPGGRAAGNAALSLAAQPRFTELFAVGARREANRIYQATTSWLVSVTWPIYLLAIVYGPQILTVFGRSYRAGAR